jgi:hypothetical protein
VPPGLTGLAQINGRNEMTWPEHIEWDLRYVASQSFWLDLKILAHFPGDPDRRWRDRTLAKRPYRTD